MAQDVYSPRDVRTALSGDSADAILRLFEVHKSARTNWNALWANCTRYVWPEMEYFERDPVLTTPGERRTPRLYDSTGTSACERFPSVIESLLVPRNERWHAMIPPTWSGLKQDRDARMYGEALTDILFAARYDAQGNFTNVVTEMGNSFGAWGTGAMYIEDRDDGLFPILYRSVPLWEVYLVEGERGIVDRVYRRFPMTVHQLLEKTEWLAYLPDDVFTMAERDPRYKYWVVQYTRMLRPNEETSSPRRVKNCYILEKSRAYLQEERMNSWPWITPRLMKMPTEVYGRSPLMRVLPVVQSLQEVQRSFIRQSEFAAEPALGVADEDTIGPVTMMPAALNYGAVSADGRMLIQPINTGSQIAVTENMIDKMKSEIDDAFFLDVLRIIKENPDMTATAVLELTSQRAQMLTPMLGRMPSEFLEPMITRELDILAAHRLLPPMPDSVRSIGGLMEPRYDNLLSRAQRANQAIAIVRVSQYAGELAQAGMPEVLDNFDGDVAFREFADIQGAPAATVRDDETVSAIRDDRAQQQQQAALVAAAEPVSKSIDNLATAQLKTQGGTGA